MSRSNYTNKKYIDDSLNLIKNPRIKIIRNDSKLKDYLPNLVLNQVFRNKFRSDKYPLIFAIVKKTKFTLKEYNSFARRLLKAKTGNKTINLHFDSIYKLEVVVIFSGQIIDIHNKLTGSKLYETKDGSVFQRIYDIHNKIKHTDIKNISENNIQVLTLDGDGFYTKENRVEYSELRNFIISLKKFIEKINE